MFEFGGKDRCINPLALLSTTKAEFYTSDTLFGDEHIFVIDFIELFDKVILSDNLKLASPEQQQLINSYLAEEDSKVLEDLDVYLAGYYGQTDGTYFYSNVLCPKNEIILSYRRENEY